MAASHRCVPIQNQLQQRLEIKRETSFSLQLCHGAEGELRAHLWQKPNWQLPGAHLSSHSLYQS